jgi:hypothetical protein
MPLLQAGLIPSNLYAFFIRGGKILAVVFTTTLMLMKHEIV